MCWLKSEQIHDGIRACELGGIYHSHALSESTCTSIFAIVWTFNALVMLTLSRPRFWYDKPLLTTAPSYFTITSPPWRLPKLNTSARLALPFALRRPPSHQLLSTTLRLHQPCRPHARTDHQHIQSIRTHPLERRSSLPPRNLSSACSAAEPLHNSLTSASAQISLAPYRASSISSSPPRHRNCSAQILPSNHPPPRRNLL